MYFILSIIIFSLISSASFLEQGSRNTDDAPASQGHTLLPGTDQKLLELEEEVQLIEKEEYDPMEDSIVIGPQEQEDVRGTGVDESTP